MHDTYYVFYTYQKQQDFTFGWRDWWIGNIVCCAQLDLFMHYAWPYGKHCWKEEILVDRFCLYQLSYQSPDIFCF